MQFSGMANYFLIVFLLLDLLSCSVLSLEDERSRNSFAKISKGYTLHYSTASFQTLKVDDLMSCVLKCLELSLCFYFNYQTLSGPSYCQVFKGLYHTRRSQLDGLVQKTTGYLFGEVISKGPNSCLDYLRINPTRQNGIYVVRDTKTFQEYDVHCDFTSEPGSAWTLVLSKKRELFLFNDADRRQRPYQDNQPSNELSPEFNDFRLSRGKMESLRWVSTHWRITCDFQVPGVDLFRDYVRAEFAEFDLINFRGKAECKKMQCFNILGYNCTNCMVPWWQAYDGNIGILHTDLSRQFCGRVVPGTVSDADSFGLYHTVNNNHRCAATARSTTNSWMGGYL